MFRRFLQVVAFAALTVTSVNPSPAHAQDWFTFNGIATEQCLGCGVTYGSFEGVLTGVVDGHLYSSARLTMSYTKNAGVGTFECAFGGSHASGDMRVSDATHSHVWYVTISRAYYGALLLTFHNNSVSGAGAGTYVIVDPVGYTCAGPARIDLRGTGILT